MARLLRIIPEQNYGPSCLILGFNAEGKSLHIHCSYPSRPFVKIITIYEPDPNLLIDFEIRERLTSTPNCGRNLLLDSR